MAELERNREVDEVKIARLIETLPESEKSKLESFIELSKDLRAKQKELDIMAADTLPSAIITAYISDILEPNNNGDLISIVAKSSGEQVILDSIYEQLSIPTEKVVYSLLKNGIAIAENSRENVEKPESGRVAANESAATEEILVKRNIGRLIPEISMIQDTSTVFPILQKEKCVGFIEVTKTEKLQGFNWQEDYLEYRDVVLHSNMDYTYVKFGVNRSSEPLQLKVKQEDESIEVYDIDIGCSLLENSYNAWKVLSILLDSVTLASLIKNAQTIMIETEIGNASDQEVEVARVKLKNLFENKLSLGRNGLKSYLSPQAKPNYIYSFTTDGVGAIKTETIGGEYNPGQLYYLEPFINAFFAGMNYPSQNFGFGEKAGLDGGGAVEEYNKRYQSTVSRFKRLLAQFIKNCLNNILSSRGLFKLVNNFDVVIYKAYKEDDTSIVSMQRDQLQVMQDLFDFLGIEDPEQAKKVKLAMVKKVLSDKTLIEVIEEAYNSTEEEESVATPGEVDKESIDKNGGENDSILSEIEAADNSGDLEDSNIDQNIEDEGENEDDSNFPDLPPLQGANSDDDDEE